MKWLGKLKLSFLVLVLALLSLQPLYSLSSSEAETLEQILTEYKEATVELKTGLSKVDEAQERLSTTLSGAEEKAKQLEQELQGVSEDLQSLKVQTDDLKRSYENIQLRNKILTSGFVFTVAALIAYKIHQDIRDARE